MAKKSFGMYWTTISNQEFSRILPIQPRVKMDSTNLVPEYECFDVCSNGWNHYIHESLKGLIVTGKGQPNSTDNPMTTDEEKFHSAAGNA
jgi:hypothetical protein